MMRTVKSSINYPSLRIAGTGPYCHTGQALTSLKERPALRKGGGILFTYYLIIPCYL